MPVAERKANKTRRAKPAAEIPPDDLPPEVEIPAVVEAGPEQIAQQFTPQIQPRPSLTELKAAGNCDNPGGLTCQACGCHNFRVDYTRQRQTGILRRRVCRGCGRFLVTIERPVFH